MSTDAMKLLSMIHNSSDPERAWIIANEIISNYLMHSQPSGEASYEYSQERS